MPVSQQELRQLIPGNPNRWGLKRGWGGASWDRPTAVETLVAQPTPLTAHELEGMLRIEGTESFVKERRVSRITFTPRKDEEQTVTVNFHSAAERRRVVRLDATPLPLQRSLDVSLIVLGGDGIEEITTGEVMDYPTLLARLRELPQLRPVSHQRHF